MLNVYVSSNIFSCDDIMCQDLNKGHHIFVVPDRYALTQENNLFDFCQKESFCNVDVLTLSRLGKMLCRYDNTISRYGSIMLISKILQDNIDKFVCFNKTDFSVEFAENIYDTINQLKVCNINSNQIKRANSSKMQDLALIYDCYEQELNGKIDSADKITLLSQTLKDSDIEDIDFYFVHFDSFTRQAYVVIDELIKKAKSVSIAITFATNKLNEHIYEDDIIKALNIIAKENNEKINLIYVDSKCKDDFALLEKNLYSYKNEKILNNNQISIYECTDTRNEVTKICILITKLIRIGYRYEDICVLMPDINNKKNLIKEIFDRYEIDYYLDVDYSLKETLIYKFLFDLFSAINSDRAIDYISLATNPILQFDKKKVWQYINECNVYLLNGHRLFEHVGSEGFNEVNNSLICIINNLKQNLKNCTKCQDFINFVKFVIQKFNLHSKIEEITQTLNEKKDLLNYKIYQQILPLLEDVLNDMDKALSLKEMQFDEFVRLLQFGIESVKVSTVPLAIDNVLVGDVSKSMVYRPKIMIIGGCNEGVVPSVKRDQGIITDGEISQYSNLFEIKPTIKEINNRERLKIFNLCICPTHKLALFYNLNGAPSTIINQCADMGANIIKQEQYDEFIVEDMLSSKSNMALTMTNYIRKYYDGINIPIKKFTPYINYLTENKLIDLSLFDYKNNPIFKGDKIISASASDIETFYSCPFMRFCRYGLQLCEIENITMDYKDIGNILHRVAEIYIKDYKVCKLTKEIENDIINKVFNDKSIAQLRLLPLNKHTLDNLKVESKRLLNTLYYQNQHTKFSSIMCEAKLGSDIDTIMLNIDGQKIRVTGKIDRIDSYKDYVRIVDYKTGSIDNLQNDLFYGKKIQLYLYGYIATNKLNKKLAGLYYFPIKLDNGQDGYSAYQLKGVTISEEDIILASDNKLPNQPSDIIQVKYNAKDGSISKSSKVVDGKELDAQISYAISMFKTAIKEIIQGNITPSPLQKDGSLACKYCPYKSICRFDLTLGNTVRTASSVEPNFLEVQNESIK